MLLEWILLIGGFTSALLTIALALYRFWFSMPGEADYVFALLLVFHSGKLRIVDEEAKSLGLHSPVLHVLVIIMIIIIIIITIIIITLI